MGKNQERPHRDYRPYGKRKVSPPLVPTPILVLKKNTKNKLYQLAKHRLAQKFKKAKGPRSNNRGRHDSRALRGLGPILEKMPKDRLRTNPLEGLPHHKPGRAKELRKQRRTPAVIAGISLAITLKMTVVRKRGEFGNRKIKIQHSIGMGAEEVL